MSRAVSRATIERLMPHQGASLMLDAVLDWDDQRIVCETHTHLDAGNPLRHAGALSPLTLIEYGAQAMALHAGLVAEQEGRAIERRLLVSAQAVELEAGDLSRLAGPLTVEARRRLADANGALYEFTVRRGERRYASGRVAALRGSLE